MVAAAVVARFEADYAEAVSAGELDDAHPSSTVDARLSASDQQRLAASAQELQLPLLTLVQPIAFTDILKPQPAQPRGKPATTNDGDAAPRPRVKREEDETEDDGGAGDSGHEWDGSSHRGLDEDGPTDLDDGGEQASEEDEEAVSPSTQAQSRRRARSKRQHALSSPTLSKRIRLIKSPLFDVADADVAVASAPSQPADHSALVTPRSNAERGAKVHRRVRAHVGLTPSSSSFTSWSSRFPLLPALPPSDRVTSSLEFANALFHCEPDAVTPSMAHRWDARASYAPSGFIRPSALGASASTNDPRAVRTVHPSSASSSFSPYAMELTPRMSSHRQGSADLSLSGDFSASALYRDGMTDSARRSGGSGDVSGSSAVALAVRGGTPSIMDLSRSSYTPSSISVTSSSPTLVYDSAHTSSSTPLTFLRSSASSSGATPPTSDSFIARALDLNEGHTSAKRESAEQRASRDKRKASGTSHIRAKTGRS